MIVKVVNYAGVKYNKNRNLEEVIVLYINQAQNNTKCASESRSRFAKNEALTPAILEQITVVRDHMPFQSLCLLDMLYQSMIPEPPEWPDTQIVRIMTPNVSRQSIPNRKTGAAEKPFVS